MMSSKESKRVRQPSFSVRNSVDAEQFTRQVQKRLYAYDAQADVAMFKHLPMKILELDGLIRSHPYLQLTFPRQLEERMTKHLVILKSDELDKIVASSGLANDSEALATNDPLSTKLAQQKTVIGQDSKKGVSDDEDDDEQSKDNKSESKAAEMRLETSKNSSTTEKEKEKDKDKDKNEETNKDGYRTTDVLSEARIQLASDMNEIIEYLSVPPLCVYELEQIITKQSTDVSNIFYPISIWLSLLATNPSQKNNPAIVEISQSIDVGSDNSQYVEMIQQYHTVRSKYLCSLKKKRLFDMAKVIVNNDVTFVSSFRDALVQLLNNISISYNLIQRHADTLLKSGPKELAGNNMY